MWSSIADMSRDECRKCLRCLELDAYGNMVSVLRAQGPYTEEKRKLLGELANILHISNERHRAEIRRAVNDEKLSVIADQLNGPNTYTDWAIEGRRTIPILPRLKAHTAFTGLANSLSLVIAAANEKKLSAPHCVEDPIAVKTEPASPENSKKHECPKVGKTAVSLGEIKTRGRKRKRLSSVCLNNVKCKKSESMETEMVETELSTISPVENRADSPTRIIDNELSNVVQVSIVTPSSPIDTTISTDNTLQMLSTEVDSHHHKFITNSFDDPSSEESNSPVNNLILESDNDRQDFAKDINGRETIIAQSEIAKILGLEQPSDGEFLENAPPVDESTKISRPDSTTSGTPGPKRLITNKLCVTTKPVITSSTVSCRLDSPSMIPSKTRTYKTISMEKLNHHSDTKMGITLNSSRTLKINAHPNARLSSKANVIVVQKGSSRGVTLSHGGKEVKGKVIMGGNNLCLANQKGNTSVTLLPHRGSSSNNGERTLTSLASNRCENIKLGDKTGNMIMLDIRQDMSDESTVLTEYLESAQLLKSEGTLINLKNATSIEDFPKNHNCVLEKAVLKKNPELPVLNGLRVELSEKLGNLEEDCSTNLYSIVDGLNSTEITGNSEKLETTENDNIPVEEMLETTTELYNCESADGIIIEDQIEESIETSGIDIFGAALNVPGINLENLECVNDEEQEIIVETSDEIVEAENPFRQQTETIDRPGDS
ncbi:BRCA2-interacting transcriptional repressor EMSY isoform X2 [Venturia canescens]|uniref:BRCA2-interacting transcriptional repressor EMSY isoform X2 n=1 Tax=Venturia canescens TaxID=32260 RepID=UPI001C9D15A0|nr:BRCA2-interacting transcriptional repressor EMSY isoform X2 [Venturia canescens]